MDETGVPYPNGDIIIPGRPWVKTDAEGRFLVTDVEVPYTLITGLGIGEATALIYEGLTRPDPTVVIPRTIIGRNPNSNTLSGQLAPAGSSPVGTSVATRVWFESSDVHEEVAAAEDGRFSLPLAWPGSVASSGTLRALRWTADAASGRPIDYTGHASVSLVAPGGSGVVNAPGLAFGGDVPEGTLSGSVGAPVSGATLTRRLQLRFDLSPARLAALTLLTDSSQALPFAYVTPDLAGASFELVVRQQVGSAFGEGRHRFLGASHAGVAAEAPAIPFLIAPAEGARDVDHRTEISWQRVPGAIYLVAIQPAAPTDQFPRQATYYIFTADTSITFPDLSRWGMRSNLGALQLWSVLAYGRFTDVNEIMTPRWFAPRADAPIGRSQTGSFWTSMTLY